MRAARRAASRRTRLGAARPPAPADAPADRRRGGQDGARAQRRPDRAIGSTRRSATRGSRRRPARSGRRSAPSVQRNNQLQPPASFLIPTATRTDVVTSNVGLSQRLPWFGTSYSVGWDASHTDSNSFLNSYNPLLQSGLSLNVSQPLLRDLVDRRGAAAAVDSAGRNRDIADTRLRESLVQTTADVKTRVLEPGRGAARTSTRGRRALELAEELARVNKAKVDVGQSPPLDLVSAQAEVAANQEQLIVARDAVEAGGGPAARCSSSIRPMRDIWNVQLEPIDSPPVGIAALDVDAAVTRALARPRRSRRARARTSRTRRRTSSIAGNQRLPDVRVNASYQASGLGGTAGAALRRLPRNDRRRRARSPTSDRCSISCSAATTRPGRSASASRIRSARAPRKPTTRAARLERSQARAAAQERRGARHPAGARRRRGRSR